MDKARKKVVTSALKLNSTKSCGEILFARVKQSSIKKISIINCRL